MKTIKQVFAALLFAGLVTGALSARADDGHSDQKAKKDADAKPFPAAKCLISGEGLDSMGKPYVMVVDGQELKFCCKSCVEDYEKDKVGFMKKVAQAEAKAKPYTLDTCVISGDEFDHGKPFVFASLGQKVKLCCKDCLADFKKSPAKYLVKITAASKEKK